MLTCRNCATFFPRLPNFMLGKRAKKRSYLTPFSNATSVPGKRHTATFGSPIAANPRVMEFWNFVVTSLSPTLAGPDATRSRLQSHIEDSPFARHASERRRRTLEGVATISSMEYRTLWDGVSVALILRLYSERVEAKKGNGTQGMVGMSAKAAGQKRMREAVAVEYFRFAATAFGCPCLAA